MSPSRTKRSGRGRSILLVSPHSCPSGSASPLRLVGVPIMTLRSFTACRQIDETGISGQGIVIEGAVLATGQCIVHWLYPPPRGGIAIFDSMEDFLKVHVHPHPSNKTIITFQDGETTTYPTEHVGG